MNFAANESVVCHDNSVVIPDLFMGIYGLVSIVEIAACQRAQTWPGSNARIWPKNSKTTLKSQTQLRSSHVAFPYGTRATRALRKIHIWSWLKFATAWMG